MWNKCKNCVKNRKNEWTFPKFSQRTKKKKKKGLIL